MNDDDESALEAFLMFLYTGIYSASRWQIESAAEECDIHGLLLVKYHIEVSLLADKYGIPDLRTLATFAAKYAATEGLSTEED
jgi:hypothetical protein